jgi:zinc protease
MRFKRFRWLAALIVVAALSAGAETVDIPYTEFQLDNGLTVIVHEDTKAPIVAVNIWYHVGSKNEKPGKTGFAHLFEHLMFNGTENYDDEFFGPFEKVGATGQNGTTSFDRTNYFQTVPKTAVDLALWMESDRMGHLLGAIDQDKLDEQRGVVQNEKRQGENQPYGKVFDRLVEGVFPQGHPYSWLPIGSMEDLDAASLEDVQEWFRTYYGPNNAVLVLAGDITVDEARSKAEKYFGDIPPGPPLTRMSQWVPSLDAVQREMIEDRVPQTRIYKAWPAPAWAAEETDLLQLATSVLGGGKNSRLYERLVYNDQIATDVSAGVIPLEIASILLVTASVQPGGDAAAVERALDEEIERFLSKGPSKGELERVRTEIKAGFIRGAERVGGFGGKSDILAEGHVFGGSADHFKKSLDRVDAATVKRLQAVSKKWFTDGQYVLHVVPFPDGLSARSEGADRSELPYPDAFPDVGFPAFERSELSNGLKLIVANRDTVPLVNFNLLFDAGYAADHEALAGTTSLAMAMLDEGTEDMSALEISEAFSQLGAIFAAGADLDTASVSLNTLTENIDESLELFADVVLNPSFPANELERLRQLRVAAIQREQTTPRSMALRVLPRLMYGENHAYSQPLTGSGTLESLSQISRDTLAEYHDTWFRPNNATLIVVGDTTMAEIKPRLEALFDDWEAAEVPKKTLANVRNNDTETVYLIDRPNSEQSIIFGGHVIPPKSDPADLAIEAMIQVLGGDFTARINMNLREDKAWAYGAYSYSLDAEAQRPFIVYAPVQTDKTAASVAELRRELREYLDERPATEEELARVRDGNTLSLPGRWETIGAVAGSLGSLVRFDLPDDYWSTYAAETRALTVDKVNAEAERVLEPGKMIWVIVGDRARIESEIRALEIGPIQLIDTEGNPLGE